MVDLDAVRARRDAASPGPWSLDGDTIHDAHGQPVALTGRSAFPARDPQPWHRGDAQFITHARGDVDALLTEVDRLRAAVVAKEQALLQALFRDLLVQVGNDATDPGQTHPSAWHDHDHAAEHAFLDYVADPTPENAHAAEQAIGVLQRRYDHVLNRLDGGTGEPPPFPVHQHNPGDHPEDCLHAVLHELAGARREDRAATLAHGLHALHALASQHRAAIQIGRWLYDHLDPGTRITLGDVSLWPWPQSRDDDPPGPSAP